MLTEVSKEKKGDCEHTKDSDTITAVKLRVVLIAVKRAAQSISKICDKVLADMKSK